MVELNRKVQMIKTINSVLTQLTQSFSDLQIYTTKTLDGLLLKNFDNTTHFLQLKWHNDVFNVVKHSLPDVIKLTEPSTALDYVKQFYQCLEHLSQFYSCLAILDCTCCVIEPSTSKRSTKDCYRIIKYAEKVYLYVELNPLHSLDDISIRFIGPEYKVKSIREEFEERKKRSEGYRNEGFLRYISNLVNVQYFPELNEGMVTEKDCSICLDYYDDFDHAPLNFCENDYCAGVFHASCLKKFIANKQHKVLCFDVVTGPCPMLGCNSYFKFDLSIFSHSS